MTQFSEDNTIYAGVHIGEGTRIEPPCIIGKPCRAEKTAPETVIGSGCIIRPFTTIYAGARLGDRVQTGQGVTIREDNVICDDVSIGTNAVLEPGNTVGARSRVHTGCFLELVTVGEDVFIGPNVVFADDPHPPCPRYAECIGGAVIGRSARIGANTTVLPGVSIGEGALVGAGSVVTKDVEGETVMAGSPARCIKSVSDLTCTAGFFERPYEWGARRP